MERDPDLSGTARLRVEGLFGALPDGVGLSLAALRQLGLDQHALAYAALASWQRLAPAVFTPELEQRVSVPGELRRAVEAFGQHLCELWLFSGDTFARRDDRTLLPEEIP